MQMHLNSTDACAKRKGKEKEPQPQSANKTMETFKSPIVLMDWHQWSIVFLCASPSFPLAVALPSMIVVEVRFFRCLVFDSVCRLNVHGILSEAVAKCWFLCVDFNRVHLFIYLFIRLFCLNFPRNTRPSQVKSQLTSFWFIIWSSCWVSISDGSVNQLSKEKNKPSKHEKSQF